MEYHRIFEMKRGDRLFALWEDEFEFGWRFRERVYHKILFFFPSIIFLLRVVNGTRRYIGVLFL